MSQVCTILNTINFDIEQCSAAVALFKHLTNYAQEETNVAMLRYLDAERKHGIGSPITDKLLKEVIHHHEATQRLDQQFKQSIDEYEDALFARISYFTDILIND